MKKIYLIHCEETNRYKIGVSKTPKKRLQTLQTGNDSEIKLIHEYETKYAYKIEKSFHNLYSYLKTKGEWFDLDLEFEVNFLNECKRSEETFQYLDKHSTYNK